MKSSMEAKSMWVAIIVALISAISAITVAWIQSGNVKKLESNTISSLADGQKLCHVHAHGQFMNSLIVPASWRASDCKRFAEVTIDLDPNTAPVTYYALGCIFGSDTSLGTEMSIGELNYASAPKINCGWDSQK